MSEVRRGSGPPLVLIHGGGATWRQWRPVIPLLEPHHDVLAVTLAGHWGGPRLPDGRLARIDDLVAGVEHAMDRAGFDDAYVAGTSLGSFVALELAKRRRARSVVAFAPAGGAVGKLNELIVEGMYRSFRPITRLMARRPWRWSRSALLRRALYWHHFHHPERMDPDDCAYLLVGFAQCAPFARFTGLRGGARDLDRVRCPVLLAFPEHDLVLPRRRYGEPLIRALPSAEVVELLDVGHSAMSDDPSLVAKTILDFAVRT